MLETWRDGNNENTLHKNEPIIITTGSVNATVKCLAAPALAG